MALLPALEPRTEWRRARHRNPIADVVYRSRVRIERLGGSDKLVHLPAEREPFVIGSHSEVAEHYGVDPERFPPRATTLDWVFAAACG